MKVQVLKRMISDGKELLPGDIVDASGWRHVKALESNRYIKVLTNAPVDIKPKAEKPEEPKVIETPKAEESVAPKAPKKVTK